MCNTFVFPYKNLARSNFHRLSFASLFEKRPATEIISKTNNEELKKLICARQLRLSVKDTQNLVSIKLLNHNFFKGLFDTHMRLEVLFSFGAIALTEEQISRINEGLREECYPTIKEAFNAIRFNTNIQTVTSHPYMQTISEGVCVAKAPQSKVEAENCTSAQFERKFKQQAEQESKKKIEQEQNQKEAEDFVDEIFAEAQKNIERGR